MQQLFDKPFKLSPEKVIEIKKHVQQEYKLMGSIRVRKGLTLYQYNMDKGTVEAVDLQYHVSLDVTTGKEVRKIKAFHNPSCIYIWALNIDNAVRKFRKMLTKHILHYANNQD